MRFESLSSRRDFDRLGAAPRRRRDGVTVHMLVRPQGPRARVGFAVARGVGTAVARNRIKRRLRAALRALPQPEAHVDVLIRADRSLAGNDFQTIVADVGTLLATPDTRSVM